MFNNIDFILDEFKVIFSYNYYNYLKFDKKDNLKTLINKIRESGTKDRVITIKGNEGDIRIVLFRTKDKYDKTNLLTGIIGYKRKNENRAIPIFNITIFDKLAPVEIDVPNFLNEPIFSLVTDNIFIIKIINSVSFEQLKLFNYIASAKLDKENYIKDGLINVTKNVEMLNNLNEPFDNDNIDLKKEIEKMEGNKINLKYIVFNKTDILKHLI